ncbi:heparan sulfate glucosamine 3-O-sulfotransferase 5-like [Diadema setosum]|uniref:heparan sulfate glucosamine 3-O-sulfotransferase 5-like n=1 Tax=Diadema setosum TaxID=31175 RepID=UPI003B3B0454
MSNVDCDKMKVNSKPFRTVGCRQQLPRAMIVGVKKCGTGMLREYIGLHPSVRMVIGATRFPGWFGLTSGEVDEWRRQMRYSTRSQLTMTESPGYTACSQECMLRLKPYLHPDTKIIAIIREPVVRAISDYVHWLITLNKQGLIHLPISASDSLRVSGKGRFMRATFRQTVLDPETESVKEGAAVLKFGRYVEGMRKLVTAYGHENVLVLDGTAFAKDPFPVMKQLERHSSTDQKLASSS